MAAKCMLQLLFVHAVPHYRSLIHKHYAMGQLVITSEYTLMHTYPTTKYARPVVITLYRALLSMYTCYTV